MSVTYPSYCYPLVSIIIRPDGCFGALYHKWVLKKAKRVSHVAKGLNRRNRVSKRKILQYVLLNARACQCSRNSNIEWIQTKKRYAAVFGKWKIQKRHRAEITQDPKMYLSGNFFLANNFYYSFSFSYHLIVMMLGASVISVVNFILLKRDHSCKQMRKTADRIQQRRTVPQVLAAAIVTMSHLLALSPLLILPYCSHAVFDVSILCPLLRENETAILVTWNLNFSYDKKPPETNRSTRFEGCPVFVVTYSPTLRLYT